jgi:catechol 2,3-dioxygenase-like lactoylglutathione lyase family enzyme
MPRPTIRHVALYARHPDKVAKFYQDVFEMDLLNKDAQAREAHYLTDGYVTLAVLPHRLEASAAHGLNHFGFAVDNVAEIGRRIGACGLEEPKPRPADRIYAEFRAADPEGTWFDLSQHGYDRAEAKSDREKAKLPG